MSVARRTPTAPGALSSAERRERLMLAMMADRRDRDDNPARWGEAPAADDLAALKRQGASVKLDQVGRVQYARRMDCFATLLAREAITAAQHTAIRRLETDMAIRAGAKFGEGDTAGFVDRTPDHAGASQAMIDAGRRVDDTLAMVGPPACRVLAAILEPPVTTGAAVDWRACVARVTSETRAEAQTALLRFAAQALADVYDALDRKAR